MRPDVLELIAEEIAGRPVDALASFVTWDEGRRKLDGMARGRRWDIDREQKAFERDSKRELRLLAKRDEQRRHRDAYLARYKRWAKANQGHLKTYWTWYWSQPENAARQRARCRRKRIAEKADPVRYAKRLASWRAYHARQKEAR